MIIEHWFRLGQPKQVHSTRISSITFRRAMPDVAARTLREKVNRAAAVVVVAFGLTACDPYVRLEGIVRDPSGAPLPDVAVILTMPGQLPDKTMTASDGSYNVGLIGADSKQTRISFEKDGYPSFEKVVGKPDQQTMDVTLIRQ
jgi:hypothetical protein